MDLSPSRFQLLIMHLYIVIHSIHTGTLATHTEEQVIQQAQYCPDRGFATGPQLIPTCKRGPRHTKLQTT